MYYILITLKLNCFKYSFRIYEGGIWASNVTELVKFIPTLDLRLNCTCFRVLRCVIGSGFGQIYCSSFGHFAQNSYFSSFEVIAT